MLELFVQGGVLWMSFLTLELIALLLAAWKAPGWVKEIGLMALITGPLGFMTGLYQAAGVVHMIGDVSMALIFGAIQVALITMIYGFLIYGLSLVIRIVQKPRLL